MKYIVLSLLSFSLLFATEYVDGELLDNPDGPSYTDASVPVVESISNEPPRLGYTYSSPVERALSREDEGSSVWPDYDWADDIEIYPCEVGSGHDFDYDEDTGDLFAIHDTDHDGTTITDSVIVYRSQDGGESWSHFGCGTSSWGQVFNPKIRVVKDSSGDSWVVIMGIWASASGDVLWTRRFPLAGGTTFWEQVDNDASFADMDADIGSGAYVYATYVLKGTTSIRVIRNALDGSGWVDDANVYANTGISNTHPAIATGDGGLVAVAFTNSTATVPEIRIKRSTNNGASWFTSLQVNPAGGWDDLDDIDIAFNRGTSLIGWITITFDFGTGDDRFGYFSSTTAGVNWAWETLFNTGDLENHGSIRADKTYGHVTVAYNEDPGDSTMFSWATTYNPTDFTTPVRINDFNATQGWPATAGWNGYGYSAILYTNFTSNYRLMFDWWGNVGIDDASDATTPGMIQNAPNPFNATTNISFNLTQNSPVTISIYNIAGQLVTTLADNQSFNEGSNSVQWDGQNESGTRVSPGVYFCRLNADGISRTHRMLMVR